MDKIARYICMFVVIMIMGKFCPSLITVNDWRIALIVAFAVTLVEVILSMIIYIITTPIMVSNEDNDNILLIVALLLFVVGIIFYPITLYIASTYIKGFKVLSVWGYVILTFVMVILAPSGGGKIEVKEDETNKNE